MLKNFSKDVFIYGAGLVAVKAVSIIALPLITSFYSIEEIGVIELVNAFISIAILFVVLNVDTAVTYYYWDSVSNENLQREYFSTSLVFVLFTSIVAIAGIILLHPVFVSVYYKQNIQVGAGLIAGTTVIHAVYLYFIKLLRLQRKTLSYNIVSFTFSITFLGFLFIFLNVLGRVNLNSYFISNALALFLALLISVFKSRHSFASRLSFSHLKNLLNYSIPLVPFSIATVLMRATDKWFINFYQGTSDVGVYSIAGRLSHIIVIFISAFSMTYGPFSMSIKDKKSSSHIYSVILNIYVFASLLLVLLIQFSAKLLTGIFVRNYVLEESVVPVFGVIALGSFVHSLYGQLGVGLHITRNTKYISFGSMIALAINIVSNIYFVKVYGMLGAAISTLISYAVVAIWIVFISNRFYKIRYDFFYLFVLFAIFSTNLVFFYFWISCHSTVFLLLLILSFIAFMFFSLRKIKEARSVFTNGNAF